ncbi:MAG: efflux RND transporter permease subunit [Bacteroidales bacterium]|nr:efflux RND transporter permease subunit [Bacteroidales bacterium]
MLDRIIKFSLNNKLFILLGAVMVMAGGVFTTRMMDVDVFPDLTAPTVVVLTDAHNMAAEEVERLVTFPIETAVNGATEVRRVRSASSHGFSFVWVEFDWGTDIYKARQVVSEKLVMLASVIPEGIEPALAPQSSVMGEILFIGLQSDSTSMMELRTLAEWNLKPVILATGGVSQVTIIGGDYKQYQVMADPDLMKYYGVSLHELARVCENISMNKNGGVLRQFGNEYVVRGIARSYDLDELGNAYIKTVNGKPVRVRDLAEVRVGSAVKMGHASQNASPSVILSVSKQPNINTVNVTERIEENLEELRKSLPPDVRMTTDIFRQADFIGKSVDNVGRALIEGAIFVVIILFLFLGSFRTTIISVLAIPISLLTAMIVMYLLGMNINTMTLGGLAIAIGSLVDDAIIDVENVYKRLRQNHSKPPNERASAFKVVFEASREIRASILNATLIIIVAFIPLFFLSGMEGRMLKPLGIAYIVSLSVSLLVAITLTPLLCKMLLSGPAYLSKRSKEGWLTRNLSKYYQQSLVWALRRKALILSSSLALFVLALLAFSNMGRSFLPEFNEGSLTISAISSPGISLEESNALGNLIETELLAIPEVSSTARRTGRGELDEHSQTTNSAEIDVNFELDDRSRQEFLKEVRATLDGIPGIASTVGQPLGHRIDHMLSGTRANIAIKLFGTDLITMFNIGKEVQSVIADIPGLVDVSLEQQTEIPQIQVKANREMLAHYGITLEEFNEFVEIAFAGKKLSDIYEDQERYDLVLWMDRDYNQSLEGLKTALISTYDGRQVPMEQVAEIVSVSGPNGISRENVQRKIVISANVAGSDIRTVVNSIRDHVNENIVLPEGYRIEYGGQFESEAKASQTLLITSILAIFVIFLILFQEFRNARLAGIILLNLPLALIGGVFAVFFTSAIISIPVIIGFITLFGIATRNGILLVSRYRHMQEQGEELDVTILKGSTDRLYPILMTALTAALALIPLALNGGATGNEIQSPMAKVILGGLLSSTLLNIYVVPLVYSIMSRRGILKNEKL